MSDTDVRIVPIAVEHRNDWDRLFQGYADFYRVDQTQAMRDRVWDWLNDPDADTEGFVAVDATGRCVGLTHFAKLTRPLHAATACLLNDLFVEPDRRGEGIAEKLIEAVAQVCAERGWTAVRWLTAETNYRARGLYDQVAVKTPFLVYEQKL
ncbi:MAG: GNAT family N-acetyltransferase [Pseudomonadota bacterium]